MVIRIGISGWRYDGWRGVFYPAGLAQRDELAYASRTFPSIEINGTFYSLQRPECFAQWYRETPPGFVFAVKGSRYITHMLKLRNVEAPLANFFAQGLFNLREKLGPLLWQFPENFRFDAERLERFFALLPRDTEQALELARRRDHRLLGRARLAIDAKRKLRHAIEIRHRGFLQEGFVRLLRRHRVALVVADTAGKWPYQEDVTADFVYLRLHGDTELYASGYSDAALERWAARVRAWSEGNEPGDAQCISRTPARMRRRPARMRRRRDVYCYFDNDAKVQAPFDAGNLAHKLGMRIAGVPGAAPSERQLPSVRSAWPDLRRRADPTAARQA